MPSTMEEVCKPVLTKHDFVRRYVLGHFGNRSPTYNNVLEFLEAGCGDSDDLYHIRNRVAGGQTWYDIRGSCVASTWQRACAVDQINPHNLYISEMAPTHLTTLQGEVQLGVNGLDLFYTRVRKPMREALVEDAHRVEGYGAKCLLETYMNSSSYDWLQVLLGRYPGHVVEFSCYSRCWGTIPGYNTVIWEVRCY